jgi:y4mF family transcriptional regulator
LVTKSFNDLASGDPAKRKLFLAPTTGTQINSAVELGRLIKASREKMKLTQQQFADLTAVGRRFISELENGKATLEFDRVLQVCKAAGIDLYTRQRSAQ